MFTSYEEYFDNLKVGEEAMSGAEFDAAFQSKQQPMTDKTSVNLTRFNLMKAALTLIAAKEHIDEGDADSIEALDGAQESYESLLTAITAEEMLLLIAVKEDADTARAVIAQAIHVGANSFGHITGEHEELVETLTNAGFPAAAQRVDAILDEIGGGDHCEVRLNWLRELRNLSACL